MSILPVVERELRVTARKPSTCWLRVAAAGVALLIGGGVMILGQLGAFPRSLGAPLFAGLTWVSVIVALSTGLFFTADCLSEEKRDGTLGLLFLTDLRGYDVVLGKLAGTSLRAFYGLLAIFPILGLTLLLGGVSGLQFWKMSLALVNALVCSLAAGLCVSALSRDSQKAMAGTFMLLLALVTFGALADEAVGEFRGRPFIFFNLFSPFYPFQAAGAWGGTQFWTGLLLNQVTSGLFLGIAMVLLPRTWQDKGARSAAGQRGWRYAWKYGRRSRRERLRRDLLPQNPVLWLACRERWQAHGIWLVALVFASILALDCLLSDRKNWFSAAGVFGWFFVTLIYLWTASQAGRFFIEARQTGLMELLIAAPLSVKDIVFGQWQALVRMFGAPVLLVVLMSATGTIATQFIHRGNWGNLGQNSLGTGWALAIALVIGGTSVLGTLANLVALCWFGMWMGLSSKKNHWATLKTILFVQIIPAFVITIAANVMTALVLIPQFFGTRGTSSYWPWYPLVQVLTLTSLSIGKDIGFILWSRKKLYGSLREEVLAQKQAAAQVAQAFQPAVSPTFQSADRSN